MRPTLQPSKDGRPKVLLETKKRGAAPARPASESPSEAKKRQSETAVTSSTGKRRKTLLAEAVNPLAMEVINQFSRKARGTPQSARAPRMRPITVELERSSVRGSDQRPAAPKTRMGRGERGQDKHVERGGEQSGDKPETRSDEELAADVEPESLPEHTDGKDPAMQDAHREGGSPELDVASHTTPEPGAEQNHTQLAQPEPTRRSGRHTDGLPTRSRQDDDPQVASRQETSSQRTTQRSNRRVPKPAFDERPMTQEADGSVSKSASAAPDTAEQLQAASTKTASEREHLKELFENDLASPRKTAAQGSLFVSDCDSEDQEASDEGEKPLSDDDARDAISHVTSPTTGVESTVQVPSKEVRSMCHLMGKKAWTARGKSWAREISHPRTLENEGLPNTQFGQKVCKLVTVMRKDYKTAPQVHNAGRQKSFLLEKAERTEKAIAEIAQHIDKTCDRYYKAIEGEGDRHLVSLKDALRGDIIQCVIPLLALLLRDFFFLGGSSVDADGHRALPEKGGEFTATTLQLLERTAGWIIRLAGIIKRETELSVFEPASDEEEEQTKSPAGRKPDTVHRMRQERAKQRVVLAEYARQLWGALSEARDKLDEDVNKEARRRAMVERAAEHKAQKEKDEREAEEGKRRRYEAMCASTQRLRNGLGPVSSMWVKAQQLEESRAREPTAVSVRVSIRPADVQHEPVRREQTGSPDLDGFFDEAQVYHPKPQADHHDLHPPASGGEFAAAIDNSMSSSRAWTVVESQWLLRKLKEGGRLTYDSWAEALGRRIDEVRQEAHLLKVSTRSLAEEAGKKPPLWARR